MSETGVSWLRRGPVVAASVALLVYLPSLGGGFLYDDVHVVVGNRAIRDLTAIGTILRYEPSRPLLVLTWALNYAVGGLRPWSYHLVSVLIHAGNAAFIASLFLWMALRSGHPQPRRAAALGACLFAASPMAAETVAYVSSRSTALATLFGLASLRLAVDVLDGGPRRRLAASLGLYLMALATKEEAVSIPLLLLLLDLFFVAGLKGREVLGRGRLHLPFLLLPALGLLARRAVTGTWLPPPALDHGRYLATQVAAFPLYFLRALVPLDPAFYRGQPASPWPPDAATLLGGIAAVGLLGSAVAVRRRWPDWSFAPIWLAAGLLPSSSLVPLKEMVVDHRAYLGGAGVLFALGGLVARSGRKAVAVGLVTLLGARALHYEWVLADPVRAWEDAVRRAPRSVEAHIALGEAFAARRDARAEFALRTATALDPGDAHAWTNLGAFYVENARLDDAEPAMRAAARAAPADPRIRDNLGLVLQALGREDEAIAEFEAAIAGRPPLAQPRINLAAILIRRGQKERARALIMEISNLPIDDEDARAIDALWPLLK